MNKQIFSIQYLRGVAAILVVFYHVIMDVEKITQDSIFLNFYDFKYFGNIGVDIFFVISGFIMTYVHGDDFQKNMSIVFLKKRISRVVPLYWVLTIIATLMLYFMPSIFGDGKVFDLKHVVSSLLFIPSKNSIGIAMPVIGPGWSLNYEIYFYIIFSFLLFFPKKYFLKLISSFLLISVLFSYIMTNNEIIKMITNPMLIEFLFGIYIARLYEIKRLPSYKLIIIFAFVLIFINIYIHFEIQYRILFYGITSALLVLGFLSYEVKKNIKKGNIVLLFLANISYSLYLSHVFAYKLIFKIFSDSFCLNYPDITIILAILFSIIIAYVVYLVLEKPLTQLFKKFLLSKGHLTNLPLS